MVDLRRLMVVGLGNQASTGWRAGVAGRYTNQERQPLEVASAPSATCAPDWGGRSVNANLALVIVTDVDACLVDRETYSHEAAADALEALRRSDVPIVLCSSKTRAELIALQQTLGIAHPFISENGGAVDVPVGY